jgi:ketosteroid isomerase-like protein
MASNPNLLVQQQFVAAVFAGDGDTIRSLAAADFELAEGSGMPFAGTYRGAEGFLEFLGVFNDAFDLEYLRPVRHFASDDPDRMAFEFELRGVHRATGELFESSLIEAWTFRDGRVVAIKPHYFNVPKPR